MPICSNTDECNVFVVTHMMLALDYACIRDL